jgi:hypothetical protein
MVKWNLKMTFAHIAAAFHGSAEREPSASKLERVLPGLLRYLSPRRTSMLHHLTEQQLRDIGAEPAVVAGITELRALDTFRGPGGRTWVLLMHRGPGS